MNTIAPPPQIKRLPPNRRALGIFLGFVGGGIANVAIGYAGFQFWTRKTTFVPYDTTSPDLQTPVARAHNPNGNPPVCIDHAVRTIPLSQLKSQDQKQLTTDFCRGVWSGLGYAYQRRYLDKKYRSLEGRTDHLWDREELGKSEYAVGTKITDHFEVVEHDDSKVIVRCGDSPFNAGQRPSDGLFTMGVTKDEEAQTATFHLKSVFINTTPEGKDAQPLPWRFQFAHRLYTKLWMETAVRKLYK
ncbi:hypothetical protein BU24DRAFT_444884 [Aaosphaeria arxii CBS 175.79]|uniref:Uncharacterized protein n=1 Tax=Aaosphaeria arxii CBS 175.79 TaxID=1450172 RepID=A0A6A5X998_9PLEO|nr:uncharacterized protein BU24DRAFT_444884 [Aaosphaeria arxii CBS 175.79]KAF2009466.1 hypothetical protein BU24DRAFT_444884 [Aaosphaeria arxii CBS 175.79]